MDNRQYLQLINHLQYNFYPSIADPFTATICQRAIDEVNCGRWETPIWNRMDALDIVEHFHLEFFCPAVDGEVIQ